MLVVLIETWPSHADGVDVNTGAKKMRGGRVADSMRSDPFLTHLRHAAHGDPRMSRHNVMNAEACKRLRATIEEHALLSIPPSKETLQVTVVEGHSGQIRTLPPLP
jgi:hypothetical protein